MEPEAPAAPAAAPEGATTETAAPVVDNGVNAPEREAVPWSDYKALRDENASYRKQYQPYEKVFSQIHEFDRAALMQAVETYANNPAEAAAMFRQYADAITNGGEQAPEGTPSPEDQPITKAEFAAWQKQEAQNRSIAKVEGDARKLGYSPDGEGKAQYVYLLAVAQELCGGDIKQAHELIELDNSNKSQAAIDKYLADKANGSGVTPTPPMGGAPSGENRITTLAQADAAAKARIAAAGFKKK